MCVSAMSHLFKKDITMTGLIYEHLGDFQKEILMAGRSRIRELLPSFKH